ncbi:hypothetical protein XPA_009730 [Xanthoria parietina]
MFIKLWLSLSFVTLAAAQKCQNYWKGHAAFCNPSGACDSDAYKWWGIISDRGDGDRCLTGYKHLCQCVAAGSLDACVAQAVVATPQLKGMFTTCNNGCSLWVCGIYGLKFYKRDSSPAAPVEEEEKMSGRLLLRKRRLPCEDHPEQIHCQQQPDPPPPPPPPTNPISSTPISPDQAYNSLHRIPQPDLAALLSALGIDTTSRAWSQSELAEEAWTQYQASMGNLDLGSVDAGASYGRFAEGAQAWTYYANRVFRT